MMWRRIVQGSALLFGAVLIVLVGGVLVLSLKDHSSYFHQRQGTLISVRIDPADGDSLAEKSWLTLMNTDSFRVSCGMLSPRNTNRRYPAIILLGGAVTGKLAIDYASNVSKAIIIAVGYSVVLRDSYSVVQFMTEAPAIRRALLDVVPSAMLVMDYLRTRRDVDTNKIILLGYSFGAPFVPAIIAHDKRPFAAAMVYGGGELRTLIRHNVSRYRGKMVGEIVGAFGGLLLYPLEPLRYVDKVAPIPLVMINGTEDEQVPRENVELLYAKANEPKKIVWIESSHVNPKNPELTRTIITILQRELFGETH